MSLAYDALVLDIDGTLLDDAELLPQRTAAALQRARARGVKVMLATGRSHHGVRELVAQLDLEEPSVVFNGAAVYDRFQDRLIESFTLPPQLVTSLIAYARVHELEPVLGRSEGQYARLPKPDQRPLLKGFVHLTLVPEADLPHSDVLRITLFSQHHTDSRTLYREVQGALDGYNAYCTHFPLAALASFRESHAQVVDVQPECAGKAEALRLLAARHGIVAARVVAVGDAGNDVPILRAAGLGVAMGNAPDEVKQIADRVIGSNNGPALAELIESLFL